MALVADNPTTFRTVLGDGCGADASVTIGGKSKELLLPNIRAEKWNKEVFVNLNHRDTVVGAGAQQEIIGGRPTLTVGDVKHVFYPKTADSLEYEIHLNSQPAHNWIRLEIQDSGGLVYHRQPALTQEEMDDPTGASYRPDNVVGSIAVYYAKRNNQYRTGKFGHWYRWKVTAANGKWAWCEDLKIDHVDGKVWLVAGLPAKFMEVASYPVVIGPELGYSGDGASAKETSGYFYTIEVTTTEAGSATQMHVYGYSGSAGQLTIGIADDNAGAPNSVVRDTAGGATSTSNSDHSQALDSAYDLSTGTKYHLGWNNDNDFFTKYDATTGVETYRSYTGYTHGDLAAYDIPDYNTSSEWEMSVWLDYTAAGGGAKPHWYYEQMRKSG